MNIEVLDCNNPYICLNYHRKYLSVCCDAPVTQKGLVDGKINPKLFEEVMAIAKKGDKKSAKASARLTYRFYCDTCNNECDWYGKHR